MIHATARETSVEPQIALEHEQIPVQDEQVRPTKVPEGFISTLVLQDALFHMVGLMENMVQEGVLPMAPTAY